MDWYGFIQSLKSKVPFSAPKNVADICKTVQLSKSVDVATCVSVLYKINYLYNDQYLTKLQSKAKKWKWKPLAYGESNIYL